MITNFKLFENESDNQYIEIHRELNKIFTGFRENISFLKNIWFILLYFSNWRQLCSYKIPSGNPLFQSTFLHKLI